MLLTPSAISTLRTSVNKFQTDLNRVLSVPSGTNLTHLPQLLLDYSNLRNWLQHTSLHRLSQLRRLVDNLLLLQDHQWSKLSVDTVPAAYVMEWVISRHNALYTTAPIVKPRHLDISPSFAPGTLIQELTDGISPQVPWQFSLASRTTPPPPLVPYRHQPLQAPSPPPQYHPMSPVYRPFLTPEPSCPSTTSTPTPSTPPLQGLPLPSAPLTNPSLLLANQSPNPPRTLESYSSYQMLPPLIPLEERLPITMRLISLIANNEQDRRSLTRAILRTTTAMLHGTT